MTKFCKSKSGKLWLFFSLKSGIWKSCRLYCIKHATEFCVKNKVKIKYKNKHYFALFRGFDFTTVDFVAFSIRMRRRKITLLCYRMQCDFHFVFVVDFKLWHCVYLCVFAACAVGCSSCDLVVTTSQAYPSLCSQECNALPPPVEPAIKYKRAFCFLFADIEMKSYWVPNLSIRRQGLHAGN